MSSKGKWLCLYGHTSNVTCRLALLLLTLLSFQSQASVSFITGSTRAEDSFLTMSGEFDSGDADKLLYVIKSWSDKGHPVKVLMLNSPGGRLEEGYKMMYAVLNNKISTVVPPGAMCYSTCISVFAAGTQRYASPESRMGVHRASLNGEDNATARSASIDMMDLYEYLNIPESIQFKMIKTGPSDISELTDKEKEAFSNVIPDIAAATATVNRSPIKPVARTATQADIKVARNLNSQGIAHINQKQYIQAVHSLEQARDLTPADAEILGNLGYAYYMAGYLDYAQNALTSALQLKPKRGATWNNLGLVLTSRGDISWATEAFVKYWNYSSNKKAATNQLFYWESVRPGTALEQASRRARVQLGLTSPVN